LQDRCLRRRGAPAARNTANIRAGVDGDLFGLVEFYAQVDSALASGGNGFTASAWWSNRYTASWASELNHSSARSIARTGS
jgi:hypothetical protein